MILPRFLARLGRGLPVITPLAAEDIPERVVVHIGVDAIHQVVRGHERPGLGLADGNLERAQVELAERPLGDDRVDGQPVRLLLVADKVCGWSAPPCPGHFRSKLTLDGGRHALLLEALDVLGSQLARQERVLGEGLKVAPSQRVSVHADGGREEHVGGPGLGLVGQVLADLVEDVLVPCGRQRDAAGKERRLCRRSAPSVGGDSWKAHLSAPDKDAATGTVRAVTGLDRRDVLGRD